jgi:HTH-type transcriptional regulator, transcriptional repressor of NAD biosynthesis genes
VARVVAGAHGSGRGVRLSDTRRLRVTITGSESTGKTWLAQRLARHYGVTWVPEFAREYAIQKAAPLDASDVEPIARGQVQLEDSTLASARDLAILDTDLVSTVVYAQEYYGSCPEWIRIAARQRLTDLYLFCDIDVPWVGDAARDRPDQRLAMHNAFEAQLKRFGARCALIHGSWTTREAIAVDAVDTLRLSS